MSELYDRLQDLEKNNSAIREALNKQQNTGGTGFPPDEPPQPEGDMMPQENNTGSGFALAMFSLFLLMGIVIAVVIVFSAKTIDRVGTASRRTEQLEVILESQTEILSGLQEHVKAVEAEFRRAFQKDRDSISALEKNMASLDARLSAEFDAGLADVRGRLQEEFRNELTKQKDAIADQEARNAKTARDSEDVIKRFADIQEEFNSLRVKLLGETVPEK